MSTAAECVTAAGEAAGTDESKLRIPKTLLPRRLEPSPETPSPSAAATADGATAAFSIRELGPPFAAGASAGAVEPELMISVQWAKAAFGRSPQTSRTRAENGGACSFPLVRLRSGSSTGFSESDPPPVPKWDTSES